MCHTGASSKPYASQLYLDRVLDEVVRARGAAPGAEARERVSVPQVLHHCLNKKPDDLFMINSTTGERITNAQILKKATLLARWLISKGARGRTVMMVMENHQDMMAIYLAFLFAGTIPFYAISEGTTYEYTNSLKLIKPCMVFCDERHHDLLKSTMASLPELDSELLVSSECGILDDNCDDLQFPDVDPDTTVILLCTSGSSGLPKASILTHRGFITQMPMRWCHYERFPSPTRSVLVSKGVSGVCFNKLVMSCIAYHVPILMGTTYMTVEQIKDAIITYRPTYTKLIATTARALLHVMTAENLSSLETVLMGGVHTPAALKAALKDRLPKSAILDEEYGMTETHGSMILEAFIKVFQCRLLDDEGKNVGLGECGELYIKGDILFKGYFNNELTTKENFVDGWYRTGDVFHRGVSGLVYKEKKKFSFKYMNVTVSPEEIEQVVTSIPGVMQSVVCLVACGPAAGVVVANGGVTREQIKLKVKDCLGPCKWLLGGIAFVPSLPLTGTCKLRRPECDKLMQELVRTGQCY